MHVCYKIIGRGQIKAYMKRGVRAHGQLACPILTYYPTLIISLNPMHFITLFLKNLFNQAPAISSTYKTLMLSTKREVIL